MDLIIIFLAKNVKLFLDHTDPLTYTRLFLRKFLTRYMHQIFISEPLGAFLIEIETKNL